jgi:hypothetical protein
MMIACGTATAVTRDLGGWPLHVCNPLFPSHPHHRAMADPENALAPRVRRVHAQIGAHLTSPAGGGDRRAL